MGKLSMMWRLAIVGTFIWVVFSTLVTASRMSDRFIGSQRSTYYQACMNGAHEEASPALTAEQSIFDAGLINKCSDVAQREPVAVPDQIPLFLTAFAAASVYTAILWSIIGGCIWTIGWVRAGGRREA